MQVFLHMDTSIVSVVAAAGNKTGGVCPWLLYAMSLFTPCQMGNCSLAQEDPGPDEKHRGTDGE